MLENRRDKTDLMVLIARKYYYDNLPQSKIAEQLNLSRPTISRLLSQCLEEKIVTIRINDRAPDLMQMAMSLKEKYGLREVQVVSDEDSNLERTKLEAAQAAAEYLGNRIQNGSLIGLSHGTTVTSVIDYVLPNHLTQADAIQLIGDSSGMLRCANASYLTLELAKILGGVGYVMRAPNQVQSKMLCDLLKEEPHIVRHYSKFKSIDLAVVGIGSLDPDYRPEFWNEINQYIASPELMESNAVGTICNCYYDINGHKSDLSVHDRIMSIGLEGLKYIPEVIGVAVGAAKCEAVLGALRGGYVTSLFTDDKVARYLLKV